jgi:hypothetical protein
MKNGFLKKLLSNTALYVIAAILLTGAAAVASAQTNYTLTVTKTGPGGNAGIITSTPAGIDCGVACSADFLDGTVVQLSASSSSTTAAVFLGWSGACTGSSLTCDVTMDQIKDVSASFSRVERASCTLENPTTWGVRYRLSGANVTPVGCRTRCMAAGGNGYFAINAPLGWCLCGTDRQPGSTQQPTQGCNVNCPGTSLECGGSTGQFTTYSNFSPTAAGVSVSGKVTDSNGRALGSALVVLEDANGNPKRTISSPLGYFAFENITAGDTYVISAFAKGHSFPARAISVAADVNDLVLTGN